MLALHKAGLYDGLFETDITKTPISSSSGSRSTKSVNSTKPKKVKAKPKDSSRPIFNVMRPFLVSKGKPRSFGEPTSAPVVHATDHEEEPQASKVEAFAGPLYQAIYDWDSTISTGLSFRKGDILKIDHKSRNGWWNASINGAKGWVPSNYIAPLSDDQDPETPPATSSDFSSNTSSSSSSPLSPKLGADVSDPSTSKGPRKMRSWHLPLRLGNAEQPQLAPFLSRDDNEYWQSRTSLSTTATSSTEMTITQRSQKFHLLSLTSSSESRTTLKAPNFRGLGALRLRSLEYGDSEDSDCSLFEPKFDVDDEKHIPWYLEPDEPDPFDIAFDGDGSVKGATLPALVDRLTAHERLADHAFTQAFLTTFTTFASADEVIDELISRFRLPPPLGLLDEEEREDWSRRKQKVVQHRVLNVIRLMVQESAVSLRKEEMPFVERVEAFLQDEDVKGLPPAKALWDIIQRRWRVKLADEFPGLSGPVGADPSPAILPLFGNIKPLKLRDISPVQMANHLTIMESRLFKRALPFEYLNRVRSGEEVGHTDNISALIQTSNKVSNWVADLILSKDDPWKRAQIVQYLIAVAEHCRNINNFSTMVAIVCGLGASPIQRLQHTWNHIEKKSLRAYQRCASIIDSNKNFANYRDLMSAVTPPCIPFIGIYLSTLQFIERGMPDNVARNVINFRKRLKFAEVLGDIKYWHAHSHDFEEVPAISQFIESRLERVESFFALTGSSSSSSSAAAASSSASSTFSTSTGRSVDSLEYKQRERLWSLSLQREPRVTKVSLGGAKDPPPSIGELKGCGSVADL